ncbi:lipid-A-disaccharide synthase [Hydrogenophaga sp. 5NK40-0174]|uniref:lipid-A-disaccharide synthase n=1 Tax=Hydrogenophaga sp. 5NK40-0174 TaxID=3127649 RepID=UPI003105417E
MSAPAGALRAGLVAGETSGDLLGGLLLGGLRQTWPSLTAWGIGGPRMAEQGMHSLWPMERLSVFGYVDALKRLPELLRIRRELGDRVLAERPDVFIGIDAPDFNFGLERRLRKGGIKTVHFVCPSVWAWRSERLLKMAEAIDHVLCLFPFEPELLRANGIDATYVGHPLASVIPMEPDAKAARLALQLPGQGQVVAVMPGSRSSEIEHIAPRFMAAIRLLSSQLPDAVFVIPAVPAQFERLSAMALSLGLGQRLKVVRGQSHEVLAACDVALMASGTATLEAALFKRPMVIAYNMGWLSWQSMKRKSLQPWVGLPNILAREFVVPELIQDAATPEALAGAVTGWLSDPEKMEAVQNRFRALHESLRRDTAHLSAHAIQKVLEG